MCRLDRKMEIVSGQDFIPSHSSSSSEDEGRDEVVASDAVTVRKLGSSLTELKSFLPPKRPSSLLDDEVSRPLRTSPVHMLPVTTKVTELGPDLMEMIFAKLPLHDYVRLHFGLSKKWRPLTSSKVFEGEPFFLRGYCSGDDPESNPPVARAAYAFSMRKWVQLVLPPSVQYLKPVSASNGLVLFSGIPSEGMIPLFRQWWPLVVVNPITRESRSLLLMVEPLPEMEEGIPDCYSQVHAGLKVNADSSTYKVVVVHWKANRQVVQIFDSGSNQWSTVSVPREMVSYANSSNEIIFCRTYQREVEMDWSVFDIRQGKLVDCSRATLLQAERAANNNVLIRERTIWGHPTVGESCLYIVSYSCVLPFTFVHILKRERSSPTWQLVAKVPLDIVRSYLDPDAPKYILVYGIHASTGLVRVLECGKYLLIAGGHHFNWCGMLYDLDEQRWNASDAVNLHSASEYKFCDGLFFQPQLNGPPC